MSEAGPKPRGIEGQKRGNLDLSTTRKRHVEKEKEKKAGAAAKELQATARRHPRQHGCEYRSEE